MYKKYSFGVSHFTPTLGEMVHLCLSLYREIYLWSILESLFFVDKTAYVKKKNYKWYPFSNVMGSENMIPVLFQWFKVRLTLRGVKFLISPRDWFKKMIQLWFLVINHI